MLSITTEIIAPEGVRAVRDEGQTHLLAHEAAIHTLCGQERPPGGLHDQGQFYGPQVCPACLTALQGLHSPTGAALLAWAAEQTEGAPDLAAVSWDEPFHPLDWRCAVPPPLRAVWPHLSLRERLIIFTLASLRC